MGTLNLVAKIIGGLIMIFGALNLGIGFAMSNIIDLVGGLVIAVVGLILLLHERILKVFKK